MRNTIDFLPMNYLNIHIYDYLLINNYRKVNLTKHEIILEKTHYIPFYIYMGILRCYVINLKNTAFQRQKGFFSLF